VFKHYHRNPETPKKVVFGGEEEENYERINAQPA